MIDPRTKQLMFNPKVDDLYRPEVRSSHRRLGPFRFPAEKRFCFFLAVVQAGPQNPNTFLEKKRLKNTFTGWYARVRPRLWRR